MRLDICALVGGKLPLAIISRDFWLRDLIANDVFGQKKVLALVSNSVLEVNFSSFILLSIVI